jgi:membrane protease YdiL (CAAX protease family)
MVALLGTIFALAGASFYTGDAALVFQLSVAFLYMPMPLVAGLIVEKVAGRRPLILDTAGGARRGWRRILVVSLASAIALFLVNMGLTILLGNALGLAGVGRLVFTQKDFLANISAVFPAQSAASLAEAGLPPVAVLYLVGLIAGPIAGFTVNGLFAFGEEYGWRGVLMDELMPLGAVRANLLTGVMWGLWHAPVILLGFNYGADRWLGVLMMCVWVTPLSFLLWRTRQYSGSVLAPAIIHGAFNGSAGFFLLLVAARSPLAGAPVGLIGALSASIVAALVWWLTARGVAVTGSR